MNASIRQIVFGAIFGSLMIFAATAGFSPKAHAQSRDIGDAIAAIIVTVGADVITNTIVSGTDVSNCGIYAAASGAVRGRDEYSRYRQRADFDRCMMRAESARERERMIAMRNAPRVTMNATRSQQHVDPDTGAVIMQHEVYQETRQGRPVWIRQ